MEDRGRAYFGVLLLLCAAMCVFAYSLGWRQGEKSVREEMEFGQAESPYGRARTAGDDADWRDDRGPGRPGTDGPHGVPAAAGRPSGPHP